MNSPQETQLGDDLRQLASGQPFTPDLAAIGQRARQRHRRGLALRGGAAAGVAVLAAGGLFIGLHGTGGTATGTAAATATGTAAGQRGTVGAAPRTETVAYVTQQVKTALGNVNNYILSTDQSQTGGYSYSAEIWVDPRTNNNYQVLQDSNGKSVAWGSTYLVNRVLTWKTTEADYSTRTWFTSVIHAAGPIQGSTAGATNSVMTPAQIKAWLDSGKFKIVGHRVINGHQAIGLRMPWPGIGYEELWVDSQTFLPVQFIKEVGNAQLVANESWLPRTNQLVDMVNHVDIPAGFTQVAPPK